MKPKFFPSDHTYVDAAGKEYTSTTRIITKSSPRGIDFSILPNQRRIQEAAARGTIRHRESQDAVEYLKANGNLDEFESAFPTTDWIINCLLLNPDFEEWDTEVIVWSDEPTTSYAGSIDLICYCKSIGRWILWDIKTGSHSTVDYQLNLYRRAFCKNNDFELSEVEMRCIDAKNEERIRDFKVREIPSEWLDKVLACYQNGERFQEPSMELTGIPKATLNKLDSYELAITELEEDLEYLKDKEKQFKEELYSAMADAGVEKFKFGSVSATRVDPTTATTVDAKKLKEEEPTIYEKYSKTSERKGYVRLSVKDVTEVEGEV